MVTGGTLNENNLNVNWIDKLKKAYSEGKSDVEVCKELQVSPRMFRKMVNENEGFRKLVEYGRMLSQAWWEEQARTSIKDKSLNYQVWALTMKNRFGWADKTEIKGDDLPDAQTNLDELRGRITRELPKLLKQFAPELTDAEILLKLKEEQEPEVNNDRPN